MVRAGESLMKLVSDLKQYLILNDFPSVNEAISQNSNMFKDMQVLINWIQHSGKQNTYIHTIWVTNTMWLVYYAIHPITWIFKTPHPQAIKRICPLGLVRLGTFQLTRLPRNAFMTMQSSEPLKSLAQSHPNFGIDGLQYCEIQITNTPFQQ